MRQAPGKSLVEIKQLNPVILACFYKNSWYYDIIKDLYH